MISVLFRKLPMDIIKYILPYDRRFIIRKGNIILIDKKVEHLYQRNLVVQLLKNLKNNY